MVSSAREPSDPFAGATRPSSTSSLYQHPHVRSCSQKSFCCGVKEQLFFQQSVVVMRHAERLDATPDWMGYDLRHTYRNDTPLSAKGFTQARENASHIKTLPYTFDLVLSSPYLRCAQTACEIARELRLPVHFDLDLGEVFDFDEPGPLGPQHRPPEVLAEELESMYPDVELRRGADGKLVIRGAQQKHPETLLHARLRFAFKVQEAVRAASSSMMNIIVVTHADAVASIASFMNLELVVTAVPMAAFVTGQRGVGLSSGTWKNLIDTAKARGRLFQELCGGCNDPLTASHPDFLDVRPSYVNVETGGVRRAHPVQLFFQVSGNVFTDAVRRILWPKKPFEEDGCPGNGQDEGQ